MAATVVKTVLQNLSPLIEKELKLFLGYGQDLKRISSRLTAINATLEDAEKKQFSSSAIKDWLQKLKKEADEVDDILEECAYHDLQCEFEYEGINCGLPDCGLLDMVRNSSFSSFHPMHACFRYQIVKRIKKISERLDEIADERTKLHLTETVQERSTGVTDRHQTSSAISDEVYGREEDTGKIVDFLVGDASHFEDLSVYPIVGLGGLGKTTLAQHIFKHEKVRDHFELRIWVCVSEDFSLKRMTRAIIEAVSRRACDNLDQEPLQGTLQDMLQRKRYLLVLDDVWDDNQDNWQSLKSVLACGARGASILVTTRLQTVASIMGSTPHHELSKLSGNDCWKVFKQRAFGQNEKEQEELVIIGKEIVRNCGGVPLAAKTLGSLLRFTRKEENWLNVRDSKLWTLPQAEKSVLPALRLSYLNLSVESRQSFAICALFPKGKRIDKQFLVALWRAHGFISSNQRLDAEVIGDNLVNDLYLRSFLEDVHKDGFDNITSFKLHDLIHDLAESVAKDICCITDDKDVTTLSKRIHHLSTYSEKSIEEVKYLKTYILQGRISVLPPHVLKCYSLRVLKISELKELPAAIGRLKYLRYLDISFGHFKALPESLCELLNLEILILDYCQSLEKLPDNLICLKALQHLPLQGCDSLSTLPPQIGKLTSLRTLSIYIVSNEEGFLLAELGQLNLKGKLHIKHLERVKSVTDAKEANMSNKHLDELRLSWDINEESQLQENVEQILEVLQPHTQQLQTLGVSGYKGAHLPTEIINLDAIQELYIDACNSLTSLGDEVLLQGLHSLKILQILECRKFNVSAGFQYLRCLEKLTIGRCPEVRGLDEALQHMSSLQSLILRELPNLVSLPDCFANLALLHDLIIFNCHKLQCLPTSIQCLRRLQTLIIFGCPELQKRCQKETGEDWPKIAHVPDIVLKK